MANFSDKLEEIKTLLSSTTTSHKPFAYSTLLHLQEQSGSSTDPSPIQSLADASRSLLSSILTDVSDDDEEIAAQALKCLGFMIYHPTLVAAIPGDDANLILDSLTKIITTTRMKSVCNLGVWCMSIQQFDASYLSANFHSLLRAIVHALDNPIGSLSTTFEAIQAVMKLVTQLNEKMRDTSNVWAPPIYRRLVSIDKRVRDMSERCLLKIRSTICPPPLTLSKALVIDMKKKLFLGMKELLNHGMKIQTIQAWGWFIRLLGPYAVKNRHLVNEMLKIPEQTFSDVDPQVQIASLVSWEGLIDALIRPPPIRAPETNTMAEHGIHQGRTCEGNNSGMEGEGFSKSIKLIMTPIIGIMSSKCDISVHSSCFNTWCYLLHKLDTSVNCPSIIETVWEPIFDTVFRVGPDCKSTWLWNNYLDLLDDFLLTKRRDVDYDLNNQVNYQLSAKSPTTGLPISCKYSWKNYPIKWLPWDLNQLDFSKKMIRILISQGSMVTEPMEVKGLSYNAALRIFRSLLKGVQNVLKNSSINYDQVMLCLNTILGLVKVTYENVNSENSDINDLHHTCLQFVEAVIEELEPSILGSPLYKVALDLDYINILQSVNETKHAEVLRVHFIEYMDMVSPIVYLIVLYFCGVFKSTFNAPRAGSILQNACRYFKLVLSSFEPSEVLHAIIGLLYKCVGFDYLKMWIAIANGLKDYIHEMEDISFLNSESDSPRCLAVCHLLSYPFAVCSCPQKQLTMVQSTGLQESSIVSLKSPSKIELTHVVEVWKSLYVCVDGISHVERSTSNSFADDLPLSLNGCLDESIKVLECGTELNPSNILWDLDLHFLCGNIVICVLEHIQISGISCRGSKDRDDGDYKRSSGINNSLGLAARFLKLSLRIAEANSQTSLAVISRVFSALVHSVGSLHLKHDILSFVQIMSSPLRQWLSSAEIPCEDTNHQLQLLWTETLNCLQRSHPPLIFDSSFLKLQAPLLERTLDHPNPSISEPTITFWNSTYAAEVKLDYPRSLLPVLDKLSRNERINLCKRSLPFIPKSNSRIPAPQRYRVFAIPNRSSKRVELVEDGVTSFEHNDKLSLCPKRKRRELTEHQKEVRRAQQGRETDCNGHGPGIRTYTTADFSQGNEESQDSQEIRDAESILEMLRRAG